MEGNPPSTSTSTNCRESQRRHPSLDVARRCRLRPAATNIIIAKVHGHFQRDRPQRLKQQQPATVTVEKGRRNPGRRAAVVTSGARSTTAVRLTATRSVSNTGRKIGNNQLRQTSPTLGAIPTTANHNLGNPSPPLDPHQAWRERHLLRRLRRRGLGPCSFVPKSKKREDQHSTFDLFGAFVK